MHSTSPVDLGETGLSVIASSKCRWTGLQKESLLPVQLGGEEVPGATWRVGWIPRLRLKFGLEDATRLKFCLWRLLCPATDGCQQGPLPGLAAGRGSHRLSCSLSADLIDRIAAAQNSLWIGDRVVPYVLYCTY